MAIKIPKKILFGKKAKEKLLLGVNTLADAVGSTLGPLGQNVAINNDFDYPLVIQDGVTVAKNINLNNPFKDMGAEILKAAAIKQVETVGDGTTVTIILARAIANEAMKEVNKGIPPMLLKREIEQAFSDCILKLSKIRNKITTNEEVEFIATVSAKDSTLGKIVSKAIIQVGEQGVVSVEDGKTIETIVKYEEGMEFDRGYLSPYFATNKETVEAVIEDPYILVTDKKINYISNLLPFLERFVKETKSKNLCIIAGEVVDEAMALLVVNNLKGNINVVAIQAPAYGGRRIDELEDIAILTGATVIMEDGGRDIKTVQISELGKARKVIADRDKTKILGGKGEKIIIEKRIADLENQIKIANTDFDRDIKQKRMAKLAGSVATIYVGAQTEIEMKEKKERVIDAVHATKSAIKEGIVAGGEIALLSLSSLFINEEEMLQKNIGTKILLDSLVQPFIQLINNAGLDIEQSFKKLEGKNYPYGIDVLDGNVKDMIKAEIIDPFEVVRLSLENACSIANIIITTSCLITDMKEKK